MKESLYVESNNVELYTTIKGNSESEKVLIILHGGPGSGAECLFELEAFKKLESKYILVYFDQRGSGKSTYDLSKGIDKEEVIDDVHSIVTYVKNRFKDKQVYLWGGSYGGHLGFLYINKYRNTVEKYIASSPVMFLQVSLSEESKLAFRKMYEKKVPENILNLIFEKYNSVEELFNDKELEAIIFSKEVTSKSLKHICSMKNWIFDSDVRNNFVNYKELPILVLQGDKDYMCRYEIITEALKKANNDNITFIQYLGCGHSLFEDATDKFINDIVEFIER